ncbi:MAG: alpha/beta fold hydrolase [Bacteroidia bacterium]|nr:alpha/beta fold hydrolase [Bacteroidia bacterium]
MRLHFEKFGRGKPAYVFLHGFLGSGDNWRSVAKSLSLPGTYYLVDARNHGRSPHATTHRYSDLAGDLAEMLEAENWPAAHFLGHSMGGKAAMYLALHFPARVSSLVVVDIAPRAYVGGHEPLLEALHKVDLNVLRREEVEKQLAEYIADSGVRLFLLKGLARDEKGRFIWRFNLPVLQSEYVHVIAAVEGAPYRGPTLFVRGERSTYILAEDKPDIFRLFPKARIETVPQAGHWVHVDNPAYLISLLHEFWGSLPEPGEE